MPKCAVKQARSSKAQSPPAAASSAGTRAGSSRAVNVVRGSRVQITSRAPICRPSRQDSTKPGPDRCTRVTGADTRQSAPALAARRNNAFGRFFEPPATSTGENHRATVNPPTAPIGSEGRPNPLAAHAYRSASRPASPEARAANPPGVRSARSAAASSPRDLQSASSDGSGSGARYRAGTQARLTEANMARTASPSPAPPRPTVSPATSAATAGSMKATPWSASPSSATTGLSAPSGSAAWAWL